MCSTWNLQDSQDALHTAPRACIHYDMASLVGRSGGFHHAHGASGGSGEAVLQAIEELIGEFGAGGVKEACLRSTAGELFERHGGNAALRVGQVILRAIVTAKNPRLEAEVMCLSYGILVEDNATMTRIAGKYGFSKQALSKRVVKYCDEHNLQPSTYMRSKKDRKTYSQCNQPRTA